MVHNELIACVSGQAKGLPLKQIAADADSKLLPLPTNPNVPTSRFSLAYKPVASSAGVGDARPAAEAGACRAQRVRVAYRRAGSCASHGGGAVRGRFGLRIGGVAFDALAH